MATETVRLRQSPSGKFIGNPPLRSGPGSEGVIVRKHGSGSSQLVPASAQAIGGLTAIPCDLQPGYVYELDLNTEVFANGITATATYYTVYRTRNKATQVWSSWGPFNAPVHVAPLTPTRNDSQVAFRDVSFGVTFAEAQDQVEFGVYGDSNNGLNFSLYPLGCSARVVEYMP